MFCHVVNLWTWSRMLWFVMFIHVVNLKLHALVSNFLSCCEIEFVWNSYGTRTELNLYPNGYKMISFYVKNLFINVPSDKTIKIILKKIYQERMLDTNIPQKKMEKLLSLCAKHVHFSYDWRRYTQADEVAMESPLGPVLANIFIKELEIAMIPSFGN